MEDKAKLTYRSYHLINHIFLPNSNINSFMGVFIRFIFLLWRTGSLPEEKISWITLFSNVIKKLIDEIEAVEPLDEKKALSAISGFGTIWRIGIAESSKDELLLMEKATDEIFDKSYLKRSLPKIKEYIKKRIEAVSK